MQSPGHLKRNPAGVVPTLVDDDFVVTEIVVTLHYLSDLHPEKELAGDDTPRGRTMVNHWLGFINSDLHQSFKATLGPARFIADTSQHAELASNARKKLSGLFGLSNSPLTKHDWLTGSTPSITDAYLFVLLRWAKATTLISMGLMGWSASSSRCRQTQESRPRWLPKGSEERALPSLG